MSEVELERLIIRLVGDGSSYQQMMQQAVTSSQQAAQQVQMATNRIESLGTGLQGFAHNALSAFSVLGVAMSLGSAFAKFSEREQGMLRLGSVIEATGRAAEPAMAQYYEFARSIEAVTTLSKGQVMSLLTTAEQYGVTGEAAQQLTRNSIGLANAYGISNEYAMRAVIGIQTGQTWMLRGIPQLRQYKSDEEKVAAATRAMGQGWNLAQQFANTTSGQIQRLGRSFSDLSKDVGGMVASVIRPVVEWLRASVDWFKSLPREVRATAATFLLLALGITQFGMAMSWATKLGSVLFGPLKLVTTLLSTVSWSAISSLIMGVGGAILSLLNPIKLLGLVFGSVGAILGGIGAIVGLVFSPIGLIIAAVVLAIAMFVDQMGGIGPAWTYIKQAAVDAWTITKQKVQEFLVWVYPIWQAFRSFATEAWEQIKFGATNLWQDIRTIFNNVKIFALGVWDSITGGATIDWQLIRDTIRDSLIAAEFSLTHIEDIAKVTWIGIQVGFVSLVEEFNHFFNVTLPTLFNWFTNNWQEIFITAYNFTVTVIGNLAGNIVSVFNNLPGLIAGTTNWEDIWTPLTQGFVNTIRELPEIPAREMGALEQQLRAEFDAAMGKLGTDFDTFRDERLASFASNAAVADAARHAELAGGAVGAAMNRGLGKESHKFDAALSGSAEAISRIAAYQDRLAHGSGTPSSSMAGIPAPQAAVLAANTAAVSLVNAGNIASGMFTQAGSSANNFVNMLRGQLAGAVSNFQGWARDTWANISTWAQETWHSISDDWEATAQTVWDFIRTQAMNVWELIRTAGLAFWRNGGQAAWNALVAFGSSVLSINWRRVSENVGAWLRTAGTEAWSYIREEAMIVFRAIPPAIGIALAAAFYAIIQVIPELYRVMLDGIGMTIQLQFDILIGTISTIFNVIGDLGQAMWEGIGDLAALVFGEEVRAYWTDIGNFIRGLWNGIRDFVVGGWTMVRDTVLTLWYGIRDIVVNIWQGIRDVVSAFFEGGLTAAAQAAWSAIVNIAQTVWTAVQRFFLQIVENILRLLGGAASALGFNSVAASLTTQAQHLQNLREAPTTAETAAETAAATVRDSATVEASAADASHQAELAMRGLIDNMSQLSDAAIEQLINNGEAGQNALNRILYGPAGGVEAPAGGPPAEAAAPAAGVPGGGEGGGGGGGDWGEPVAPTATEVATLATLRAMLDALLNRPVLDVEGAGVEG